MISISTCPSKYGFDRYVANSFLMLQEIFETKYIERKSHRSVSDSTVHLPETIPSTIFPISRPSL